MPTPATVADIEIPQRIELVYVDYRDQFTPADVETMIHGDYPDHTDEWISDQQYQSAHALADELFTDADISPTDDERQSLVERILEADTSDPYRDLLRNTPYMLFRFSPTDDDMLFFDAELESPAGALTALDLPPEFLPALTEILPEIAGYRAEGGGYFGASFVFRCNPADLYPLPDDARVTISDPFLWLTNPYSGNGYGVVAEGCTITLPLSEIHVDSQAWGYGADDVFGGLILPDSTIQQASV